MGFQVRRMGKPNSDRKARGVESSRTLSRKHRKQSNILLNTIGIVIYNVPGKDYTVRQMKNFQNFIKTVDFHLHLSYNMYVGT